MLIFICMNGSFFLNVKRFNYCIFFGIRLKRRGCGNYVIVKRDFLFCFIKWNVFLEIVCRLNSLYFFCYRSS